MLVYIRSLINNYWCSWGRTKVDKEKIITWTFHHPIYRGKDDGPFPQGYYCSFWFHLFEFIMFHFDFWMCCFWQLLIDRSIDDAVKVEDSEFISNLRKYRSSHMHQYIPNGIIVLSDFICFRFHLNMLLVIIDWWIMDGLDWSIDDAVKVQDSEYNDISNLRKYLSADAYKYIINGIIVLSDFICFRFNSVSSWLVQFNCVLV